MRGIWEGEASAFPQLEAVWRGALEPGKMVSVVSVREGLSTRTLAAVPGTSSPKTHNPVSPHTIPVSYELPSLCWSTG